MEKLYEIMDLLITSPRYEFFVYVPKLHFPCLLRNIRTVFTCVSISLDSHWIV